MHFYLGSTYSDLSEHRDAAIAAIREFAKHGKESYVDYDFFDPNALAQTGVSHLDACLHNVKESSYFVLWGEEKVSGTFLALGFPSQASNFAVKAESLLTSDNDI